LYVDLSRSQRNDKSTKSTKNRKTNFNVKIELSENLHKTNINSTNSIDDAQKLNSKCRMDYIENDSDQQEKYYFKKSARNSFSKNKNCTNFKISPLKNQLENDDEFTNNYTNNNKTFIIELKKDTNSLDYDMNKYTKETIKNPKIRGLSYCQSYSEKYGLLNDKNPKSKKIGVYRRSFKKMDLNKNKNINKNSKIFDNNSLKYSFNKDFAISIPINKNNNNFKENQIIQKKEVKAKNPKLKDNDINTKQNIEPQYDAINKEISKLIPTKDKNISDPINKYLQIDNPDDALNNNFSSSFSPKDFLLNDISTKQDYGSSFKSESLMKTLNFNNSQKAELNKFLYAIKTNQKKENNLEMDIDNPDFMNYFSSNNGFENSNKLDVDEISKINSKNFNFTNIGKEYENNKEFNLINSNKLNNSINDKSHNDLNSINYTEKNTKYLIANNTNKKFSIIDILTQEARDKAIIKVETEQIVSPEQNDISMSNNSNINKKRYNNKVGIVNNYNNFYITEYHTYTGRKKNVKNIK